MFSEGIHGWVSNNTHNRHYINIWINTTLDWPLHRQLVNSQLIFADRLSSVNHYMRVGRDSANYWLTVNWVVDWVSIYCQPSVDDSRCWLSVYRGLIELVNQHLTVDPFSTHDPICKGEYELKMGISSRGWEDRVQTKKPFMRGVWILIFFWRKKIKRKWF